MIGRTLAHFRITAKLGEGGMGEVYRGEDTKLGRDVAIKVLPEAFTADPGRLARFEREARVLASLSHAGMAGIYEVGHEGGVHYLAMELAPGETLAARIDRGPIPLQESLLIALQIAEAVEYAHERGIVHRDLKPANVMLDPEGRVKLLDFGLARALEPETSATQASGLTHSPTLTLEATQMGLLMGTAGYMSPEQAAGKPADRRSDIWAFGVVLLEMLTGRRVFAGETVSHVLAGVLKDEPDWSDIGDVPPRLRRLLERCLRKDPRHRLQAVGDARIVLEEVIAEPQEQARIPGASLPGGTRRAWIGWAVTTVALVAGAVWLTQEIAARSGAERAPLRFELALPQGADLAVSHQHDLLAISPDGRRQAFLVRDHEGVRRIAVRDVDRLEAHLLDGSVDASTPAFSPDGEWIAFFAGQQLLKVPVGGGAPEIVSRHSVGDARGLTWADNGYLYTAPDTQIPLQRVRETGGAFEAAAELDVARGERTHRWPHAVPGTDIVLFTSDTSASTEFYDDARIEALRVGTGDRRVVVEQASRARLVGKYLVFARGGSLYAAPFDTGSLTMTGPATVVLQGVATTVASGAAHFAVSVTGDLLYLPGAAGQAATLPVWIRRDGTRERSGLAANDFDQISLAPDGRRVALTLNQGGSQDLWVADLQGGTLGRFTFSGSVREPVWSPDGRWIAYREQTGVFQRRSDGSGEPQLLIETASNIVPTSFTPDGSGLVVGREAAPMGLALLDLQNLATEPATLVAGPQLNWMSEVSPDGRWLAYVSVESGRPEVYVSSMIGGGGKWQISTRVGFEPRWSPGGSELFYRDGLGDLYVVAVAPGEVFAAGPPQRLAGGMRTGDNRHSYSVAPDGQSVLTLGLAVDETVDRLDLVLQWHREIARIVDRE